MDILCAIGNSVLNVEQSEIQKRFLSLTIGYQVQGEGVGVGGEKWME